MKLQYCNIASNDSSFSLTHTTLIHDWTEFPAKLNSWLCVHCHHVDKSSTTTNFLSTIHCKLSALECIGIYNWLLNSLVFSKLQLDSQEHYFCLTCSSLRNAAMLCWINFSYSFIYLLFWSVTVTHILQEKIYATEIWLNNLFIAVKHRTNVKAQFNDLLTQQNSSWSLIWLYFQETKLYKVWLMAMP